MPQALAVSCSWTLILLITVSAVPFKVDGFGRVLCLFFQLRTLGFFFFVRLLKTCYIYYLQAAFGCYKSRAQSLQSWKHWPFGPLCRITSDACFSPSFSRGFSSLRDQLKGLPIPSCFCCELVFND